MAKLHFLKSVTDTINTPFILESGETLVVVDGGFPSETPYLYEYLKGLGGHVTAWFVTHFHDDHMGALWFMMKDHPDIRIDGVYCHLPSDDFLINGEPKQDEWTTRQLLDGFHGAMAERGIPKVTVQKDDLYSFDGGNLTVRILRTPDESITGNPINNSSIVFRAEADGKSILFLGDLGVEGGDQLLATNPPERIRSDFVQMAHHGQGGVSKECYAAIRPTYCLWPTPSWLWDNMGPGGYDTGIFGTVVTRGWISSLRCVKRHYVMIHGTQVIDLAEA
ncbi:MAG: MBL fold metallo-hydrolase [Clostridia bacterium]|nr:MBL fold metallo-hydrolase [Clostridia bacterium]